MFFLLYRQTVDGIFDDFPKISGHFPKIFEDSPQLVGKSNKRCEKFSEHFEDYRRSTKIAEDCRRRSRTTHKDVSITPTNLSTILEANLISVKTSISSLVRIWKICKIDFSSSCVCPVIDHEFRHNSSCGSTRR